MSRPFAMALARDYRGNRRALKGARTFNVKRAADTLAGPTVTSPHASPLARAVALSLALLGASCRPQPAHVTRRARRSAPESDLRAGVDTRLLEQIARTQRFNIGRPSRPRVTPSGDAVLFLRTPENSEARALWVWERSTGQERVLATAEQLLGAGVEHLSAEERARRERMRVSGRGISSYELSGDGTRVLIPLSGKLFLIERASGATRELPSAGGAPVDARFSPDGNAVSLVRGGELSVIDLDDDTERRITSGATRDLTHAVAEFIAQEELDRMEGYWWSPDSAEIAWQETDLSRVERLRITDPLHPEASPEESAYPRVGTPNATVRVHIASLTGRPSREVRWDGARYPYLATVRWSRNAPLTLVVLNRAQTELSVLVADSNGATREVHRERDEAWLNVDQDFPRWSADGRSFLWATERNGAWQIERRGITDEPAAPLTPPDLDLRGMLTWDERHDRIFALVGDGEGSTQIAAITQRDGAPSVELRTRDEADHGASIAPDGSMELRETRRTDALPRFTVHDASGAELGVLRSTSEDPVEHPRVEFTTVTPRHLRAAVVRPRDFSPSRRYPVIAWVYGGPHSRLVARSMTRYLVPQWFADQGFVVVITDGRGTADRGRAWERSLHLRIGDVPLEDEVAALRALGAADRSLDLDRVGVMGWSFGGYLSARAVIERPDVFHAAVAGAPVTEWREYDTCYTERYLGLVDEHADAYDRASLLPHAPTLRRPLLIVHGTADDNVYLNNTLRLTDALYRAGRRFEFLPLAGQTHLVNDPERVVAWTLRARQFLVENVARRRDD